MEEDQISILKQCAKQSEFPVPSPRPGCQLNARVTARGNKDT